MKGYLPMALTLSTRMISLAPSASFTIIEAIKTLASVDLKVRVTSCRFLGPITPCTGDASKYDWSELMLKRMFVDEGLVRVNVLDVEVETPQ